jgi:hypothetical protein
MSQDRSKEIQKKIILIKIITAPANIAIGLGFYGVFIANGDAFISILNNMALCYGLVLVGGLVEIISLIKLFPLWRELSKLKKG